MIFFVIPILFFVAAACAQEGSQNSATRINAVIDTVRTKAGSDFVVERTEGVDPRYESVIKRLVKEHGWNEEYLREIFADSRTVYIPKMVVVKPRKKVNSSDWYTWVNTGESSKACVDFIGLYDSILTAVEKQYGVDKETIAALLRCETRHGTVTGDYHVLSVYASMALMPETWAVADNVENATRQMKAEGKTSRQIADEVAWIRNRSTKRGNWAFNELNHLLKIHQSGRWDVRDLYGSWAGAFGWSQFLPSSYRRLAVDGNGDGKIDLYSPADAIHSVANYLSKGGYRSGNAAKIKKALKSYNPSNDYANSIYGLSVRVSKELK